MRNAFLGMVILLLCVSGAAVAEESLVALDAPEPLNLQADQISVNQGTTTYEASGGVRLTRGTMSLGAERFWWNAATGDAGASGGVRLTDAGGTLVGDELQLNLETGTARLRNARADMSSMGFYLQGAEIERTGDKSFRLSNGSFTTCSGETPVWRFAADELRVDLGRYARARSVSFHLWDVPVFWFPYLIYPVKSERESGLLLPSFGYSRQRGAEFSLAYYQVLARNMDATVYLDYLSELGLGKGLEYRYLFGEDNLGTMHGYHVSGFGDNDSSYALSWRHNGTLPGSVRLAADLEYVSSRSFFADFGDTAEEYNKDVTESVVILGRNWGKTNLAGQFRYTQDLERSNADTLQRLPEARLAVVQSRVGETPLYYRLDAVADNFWNQGGDHGQRYQLRPALAAVFSPGGWLTFDSEVGYREYLFDNEDNSEEVGVADVAGRLSSRFGRIYGGSALRWRHTIEPEVGYRFIADENQQQKSIFDPEGVVAPANLVSYGVTTRLAGRWSEGAEIRRREVASLRLWQQYDVAAERREAVGGAESRPFSPLGAELRLAPVERTNLKLTAAFDLNPGRQGMGEFAGLASWGDGAGNEIGIDYLYRRDRVGYLGGRLATSLLQPVYLQYRSRFDSEGGTSLEQIVDVEYRAQCWSIFLTYKDRLDDREYLVSFTLAGLGKSQRKGSQMRSVQE